MVCKNCKKNYFWKFLLEIMSKETKFVMKCKYVFFCSIVVCLAIRYK
jgi:hypothetical protein